MAVKTYKKQFFLGKIPFLLPFPKMNRTQYDLLFYILLTDHHRYMYSIITKDNMLSNNIFVNKKLVQSYLKCLNLILIFFAIFFIKIKLLLFLLYQQVKYCIHIYIIENLNVIKEIKLYLIN